MRHGVVATSQRPIASGTTSRHEGCFWKTHRPAHAGNGRSFVRRVAAPCQKQLRRKSVAIAPYTAPETAAVVSRRLEPDVTPMAVPYIKTPLPGPKAAAIIARDAA